VSVDQPRQVLQLIGRKHVELSLEVSADTGNIVDTVGGQRLIVNISSCAC